MQLAVSSLLRVVWEISDFFTMHARAPIPVYILGRFYSYTNIHYTPTLQNILYTTYIAALCSIAQNATSIGPVRVASQPYRAATARRPVTPALQAAGVG